MPPWHLAVNIGTTPYQLFPHPAQHLVQVVVTEALATAIGIEGVVMPQQVVGLVWLGDGVLLVNTFAHVGTRRLPYLYPAGKRRVVVHVNLRHRPPHGGEYLFCRLHNMSVCPLSFETDALMQK